MPTTNELVPMSQYLSSPKMKNYLQSMLGNNINNFVTSLSSLTGSNPKLNECTRETLLGCALKATGMNLPFDQNLGFAWVVPFRDNRANSTVAQFQIGTKGFIQLALRSKQVTKLNAFDVREGEYKGRDRFGDIRIEFIEDDDERESKPIIGYAAAIQLTNGFEKTIYWNMAKLKNHAMTYSQSYRFAESERGRKDSIWHTNFDAMAKKTIIKSLIKNYCPMSIELAEAIKYDQSVVYASEEGGDDYRYIDNENKIGLDKEQVMLIAQMISDCPEAKAKLVELGYGDGDIGSVSYEHFRAIKEVYLTNAN
jgi:recombination protein RecT